MLIPDNNDQKNSPNGIMDELITRFTKQIEVFKNLNNGIGKIIDDLYNADHNPHLVNLEFEFTENRRRQTELAQHIIEQAAILKMDIEQILFQYQTMISTQWEERITDEIKADLEMKSLQQLYSEILALEQQQILRLIVSLQSEITRLKDEINQLYTKISSMVADVFQKIIAHADSILIIPGFQEPIKPKEILKDVHIEFENKIARGEVTTQNYKQVLHQLLADQIEIRHPKESAERKEQANQQMTQKYISPHMSDFLNIMSLRSTIAKKETRINDAIKEISLLEPPNSNINKSPSHSPAAFFPSAPQIIKPSAPIAANDNHFPDRSNRTIIKKPSEAGNNISAQAGEKVNNQAAQKTNIQKAAKEHDDLRSINLDDISTLSPGSHKPGKS